MFDFDGTLQQYFELWMSGEVAYGSWFDHIQGWWKVRNDPNILIRSHENYIVISNVN